jgi:uncharacterized protein with HEPN domain
MPPNSRDAGYLWDMLQAARRLQEFTAGVFFEATWRVFYFQARLRDN